MCFKYNAPLLLLVLCCVSCSIKEGRDNCPCLLTLDVDAPGDVRVMLGGREFALDSTLPRDTSVTWEVPRPSVRIMAVSGARWEEGGVIIPEGEQCPEVYLGVGRIDTNKERARKTLPLHKSFCLLEIKFRCPEGWRPLPLTLQGEVCGFAPDGNPKEGPFMFTTNVEDSGVCRVRIPRQRDGSLLLRLGERWTFALGKSLLDSGYSWQDADLKDVSLEIDISLTKVTLHYGGWTRVEQLSYLI